jgi:hypothetical protein
LARLHLRLQRLRLEEVIAPNDQVAIHLYFVLSPHCCRVSLREGLGNHRPFGPW